MNAVESVNAVEKKELFVYCAAGVKEPVDEIIKKFESEEGVDVVCVYGGAGELLSQIKVEKRGDVYISGSKYYMDLAEGYVTNYSLIAAHKAVIIVPKGNPKNITSLDDITNKRLSLARPGSCALYQPQKDILGGIYEDVMKNAVLRTSATQMCTDVSMGLVDASIVWNETAMKYVKEGKVEVIELRGMKPTEYVCAGILVFSSDNELSTKFVRYLLEEREIWEKYGYVM